MATIEQRLVALESALLADDEPAGIEIYWPDEPAPADWKPDVFIHWPDEPANQERSEP